MNQAKFNIYKGVLAVELQTPRGRLWWAQGYQLGYTPVRLDKVAGIRAGLLEESRRRVLAVRIPVDGTMAWVAINAPRSDVPALVAAGVWPEGWVKPYEEVVYTGWPEEL